MRTFSLLLAGLCAAAFAADDKPDAKTDAGKLDGKWYAVSVAHADRVVAWMDLRTIDMTFKRDKVTGVFLDDNPPIAFRNPKDPPHRPVLKSILSDKVKTRTEAEGTVRFDESTNPKSIDINSKEVALLGIYTQEGDQLKLCVTHGTKRPKTFTAGDDRVVIVLSRKKPEHEVLDKAIKAAREQLKGAWTVESGQFSLGKLSAEELKGFQLTFDGAEVKWAEAGATETLTVEIDPTTTSTAVDFIVTAGPQKGLAIRGLYELKKDQLTIRLPEFLRHSRPKNLTENLGGDAVLVLKRAKP